MAAFRRLGEAEILRKKKHVENFPKFGDLNDVVGDAVRGQIFNILNRYVYKH